MEQNQRTSKGSNEKIHTDEKIRLGIMLVFEAIEWRSRHTPSWQHTKSLFKPQKTELKQEQEYDEQIKKINQKRSSWVEGKITKLKPGYKEKKKCGNAYCRHRLADHYVISTYKTYRGKTKYNYGCGKCECDKMKNTKTRPNRLSFANKIRKGMISIATELCNHNEVLYVWERVWGGREYRLGDRLVDLPFTAYVGRYQ
jgi:hypothetical protein